MVKTWSWSRHGHGHAQDMVMIKTWSRHGQDMVMVKSWSSMAKSTIESSFQIPPRFHFNMNN